jgi:polyisoprenoid-binding protein YceI
VVNFFSYAPLEIIKARSNTVRGAIDISTRTFFFAISVNTFQGFNSGLQQEHFNENYIESDEFPEATFKGKFIEEIDFSQEGAYEVRSKGILELHGVKRERIIKGMLTVKDNTLEVSAQFTVLLEDHNIKVPRVVYQKISPEIEVTMDAILKPNSE